MNPRGTQRIEKVQGTFSKHVEEINKGILEASADVERHRQNIDDALARAEEERLAIAALEERIQQGERLRESLTSLLA